ncbi:hypothetical protein [Actinomadura rupiterrae]|uniref:hypothetical protein n=1 Tax=Actinomadura rupiterrae TaxID=559627 RepID=UPI0020A36B7A|nr:hypothetical protein [Actinomadura rupiterrae]MCP2335426.1 hypothetical protein [Actinomadura rupiterrae]
MARLVFRGVAWTAACVVAATSASAPTASAAVPHTVKDGCCEAYRMWIGINQEVLTLPSRASLWRTTPAGWSALDPDPHYFLAPGKKLRLSAVIGVDATSHPSKARYRWEVSCLEPDFRQYSAWTWTKIPGGLNHSPSSPVVPAKQLTGTLTPKKCTKGYVWVQYDQGNPSYGYALAASFDTGRPHPLPKTMTVWKWVPKSTADTIRRTHRYPVAKSTVYGQYFFTSRAYANGLAKQFRGYRLVQGTLSGADVVYLFTENKRTDTGIVGAFFRKKLAQPKATFRMVK